MTSRKPLSPMRKLCSIDGCGGKRIARGWCDIHYRRWKKHGDPLMLVKTPNGAPRSFYETVVLCHLGNDCLLWSFNRNDGGYGMLYDSATHSHTYIHRMVCEKVNGPPPTPTHQAAHSCGNGKRGCVTQAHLSWKTCKENAADKVRHGTQARGTGHYAAKLSDADVREIRRLAGYISQSEIGAMFGVKQTTVGGIIRRKSWGHIHD